MPKFCLHILCIVLLISCTKQNIVEKKLLYGHWKYTKAEKIVLFGQNHDFLNEYNNIEVFIDYDKNFTWTEENNEWYGKIEHSKNSSNNNACESHQDLIFNFDDGSQEVWHEFSVKKHQNKITYLIDDMKFELTKQTENTRRRNLDPVIDTSINNGKG